MLSELEQLLTHLSSTCTALREQEIRELYQSALSFGVVPRLPVAMQYPYPDDAAFSPFPHREAIQDPEKMLFNELTFAFGMSILNSPDVGDDLPTTIRPNFGTTIVASMFGARIEQVDDNPPWVRSFESKVEFLKIFDVDIENYSRGWIPKVEETYECYRKTLERYPEIRGVIKIVLPDLQGPLDNLDLLRGSDVYIDMYENPDLVRSGLELMAHAQGNLARRFSQYTNDDSAGLCHQHGIMNRGNILIRNDSSIMVSPEMYRDFVAPFDEQVLKCQDGGGLHSCGTFEHLVDEYLALDSVMAIDLGQSDMNDVDTIFRKCSAKRIPVLRVFADRDELVSRSILQRFPTGVTLIYRATSIYDARSTMSAYVS
jgi:hypothetical protein